MVQHLSAALSLLVQPVLSQVFLLIKETANLSAQLHLLRVQLMIIRYAFNVRDAFGSMI
jgi:hypothetical protein